MQLSDLSQIDGFYEHVYLSPHLDDAVLSCGGAILNQRRAGERVLVITLCTAAPSPDGPFNELAQEFHRFWALPPEQVVAARLREDAAAMFRIGADYLWAGFLDAIYRRPDAYTTRESLFGTPAGDDPLLPDLVAFTGAVRRRLPDATIYSPLGVGFHVDHQITQQATLEAAGEHVVFYEDFPYASHAGAVEARRASLRQPFAPHTTPIEQALDMKIDAIGAYASQLDELFRVQPMHEVVSAYARDIGAGQPAERVWHLS